MVSHKQRMRIKLLLMSGGLLLSGMTLAANIIKPLDYHPSTGAYTMRLWIGCPPKIADAIIDTGSANLNLLGDHTLCPKCTTALVNPTFFTPDQCARSYQDYFTMQYGTGKGKLRIYQDELRLEKNAPAIPFDFSVYTQGQQVNNVLGLAYNMIASPSEYPLISFFSVMQQQYKLNDILSLQLCDLRGLSKVKLGGSILSENKIGWQYTPIVKKDMYTLLLQSIHDETNQNLIINFGSREMDQLAILDSGTLGMIVLPTKEANTIKAYLKNYYDQHAPTALPNAFWAQGECIDSTAVNLQALPTLQFYFAKWDAPNQAIKLNLSPSRYMNTGGCGKGFVRLAFIGQDNFGQSTANFKNHNQITPLSRSIKILGTPLFENYVVTIHRGREYNITSHYDAYVGFYPSEKLCKN